MDDLASTLAHVGKREVALLEKASTVLAGDEYVLEQVPDVTLDLLDHIFIGHSHSVYEVWVGTIDLVQSFPK